MVKRTKAFTLTELLIVVVILTIAAAFTIPNYEKTVERAKDKEAVAAVRMLYDAQRSWYLSGTDHRYFPGTGGIEEDVNVINAGLHLALTEGYYWNYTVYDDPSGFIAWADNMSITSVPRLKREWAVGTDGIVHCTPKGEPSYPCPPQSDIDKM